jgi:LacI family transcriptional regulator
MAASLRQIAKQVEMSEMTVLRALRGDECVRPDVRIKIQKVAQELRYEPNLLTKGLLHRKTSTISILIPDITAPSISEVVRGAQDVLVTAGYRSLIQNSDEDPTKEYGEIRQAAMRRVDGMLMVACRDAAEAGHFVELEKRNIPLVLMNRPMQDVPFDVFWGTDEKDGYLLTRKLLERGHRRIAHITCNEDSSSVWQRSAGWQRALKEAGIDPDQMPLGKAWWTDSETSANIVEKWLRSDNPPTAIFASSDILATGVYKAAYRLKLEVGKDISVAAFFGNNQSSLYRFLLPSLSGIICPGRKIGEQAAHKMIEILERKKKSQEPCHIVEIPGEWFDGESVCRVDK